MRYFNGGGIIGMNKLGFVNSLSTKMGEEKRFLNGDDMFYDGIVLPAYFVARRRMFIEYGKKEKFNSGEVRVNFGYFHSDLAKFLEDRIQLVGGASIKYNDIFTFSCRLNDMSFFDFTDYSILSMVKMHFMDVKFPELVRGLDLFTDKVAKEAFGSFSQFQYDKKDFKVYYFGSPISINKWRIPTQLKIALGGHKVNDRKVFIPLTDLYGLQFYSTSICDYGVSGSWAIRGGDFRFYE
jgi:hypothetical protein